MTSLNDIAAFDRPGTLSIVMQGGLSPANLVETAHHALHWRRLFPAAQLVLAISVTDILVGERAVSGELHHVRLAPHVLPNASMQLALDAILRACDSVILSEGALPLPKIKNDSAINNVNLQRAAALAGLAAATGAFCLRIRADMIFADRDFLSFYFGNLDEKRGATARLRQRVMISEYFTLNPFTLERMPLHFSDWFHFGLLNDVRDLWIAPPFSYTDSIHYRLHSHQPHSNALERQFYTRIAVEQHLALGSFQPELPALTLAYHNDPSAAELGCRILADNFVLCDIKACKLFFEKYDHAKFDREMSVKCITHADWAALTRSPDTPCEVLFASKIAQADRLLRRRDRARLGLWRWLARSLRA